MELQLLSELGVVGAALLLRRRSPASRWAGAAACRLAPPRRRVRTVAVAGLGVAAWLVHTSVDWLHLLPGITAIVLVCAIVHGRRAPPRPAAGAPGCFPSPSRW